MSLLAMNSLYKNHVLAKQNRSSRQWPPNFCYRRTTRQGINPKTNFDE